MVEFNTYSDAEVPEHLGVQAMSFMRVVWAGVFDNDEMRLNVDLGWSPEYRARNFIISEKRALVSFASVIHKTLEHGGRQYNVAGLSSVLTYPQFRSQGHATRILEAVGEHIHASDADVAILFCDAALEPFYARFGWSGTPNSPTLTGDPAAPERIDSPEHPVSRMMLYVTDKARQAREAFENEPVYIGWHSW